MVELLYNFLGEVVINTTFNKSVTTIDTHHILTGIYAYKLIGNNKIIQSGKLISNQ